MTEKVAATTIEALGTGYDVRFCDGADRAALLAAIPDADAVVVRSATKIDSEVLAA
ncbi:MAG TPA: phosphoglycerate dehydrogenase, partial [Actinopolymorphaceae bacterium]